jgi:ATP-dependent DNA helicase RecG
VRSGTLDAASLERLEKFAATDDGFELARLDLEMRGQGDFAGVRQSGRPLYRLADPLRDRELVETARREAREILDRDLLNGGGEPWQPLRQRLGRLLEEAGTLVEAG